MKWARVTVLSEEWWGETGKSYKVRRVKKPCSWVCFFIFQNKNQITEFKWKLKWRSLSEGRHFPQLPRAGGIAHPCPSFQAHSSSVPPPGGVGGKQPVQERGRGGGGGHCPPYTQKKKGERGREPGASGHRPTTSVAGGRTGKVGQTAAAGLTWTSHCPSSVRGPGWCSLGCAW